LGLFPKSVTKIVGYPFEKLNLLAPFPSHLFLCFFLPRLGENPASAHFQGIPTEWTWKFFFGWVELNTALIFLNPKTFGFLT